MKLDLYQIDAFADRCFTGNPAAVCPLEEWLDESVMQAIAQENNLAETAYFVPKGDDFELRWFTPQVEVKLCGHATLASAYVLFNELGYSKAEIVFHTKSGALRVAQKDGLITMDFPAQVPQVAEPAAGLYDALGVKQAVETCLFNEDYIVVLNDEAVLRSLQPDFGQLSKVQARGIVVTSRAEDYDFVSRFFAPQVGINEDPVTGSAFTKLVPYWAERLAQQQFKAKQVSTRGGEVICALQGDRVQIIGAAVKYMHAQIEI